MVNEQLTEWIAAIFLITLVKRLPFLCLSSGPQEAQAEQWSPKAAMELEAATKSPEPLPEHRSLLQPQEKLVCVTRSLQVWQHKALCRACHLILYHLIPLNSARRSQVLLLFQISAWFSPLFTPSWERCALLTLLGNPSVSWLYWSVEKPWDSFGAPKKAPEAFIGEGTV